LINDVGLKRRTIQKDKADHLKNGNERKRTVSSKGDVTGPLGGQKKSPLSEARRKSKLRGGLTEARM